MTAALVAVGNVARYQEVGRPPGARYQVASASQQFAAAALMVLGVDLSEPVRTWLPDARPHITLRGLLTHTAGVPDWSAAPGFDPAEAMSVADRAALIASAPRWFSPGWHYSGPGYLVLGHVITLEAGLPYADFLKDKVFEPLLMHDTTVGTVPDDTLTARGRKERRYVEGWDLTQLTGCADIWSTPTDMCIYMHAVHTGEFLPMSDPLVPVRGADDGALHAQEYGYGFFHGTINDRKAIYHTGTAPGFRSACVWLPDHKAAIAVLANEETYNVAGAVARMLRHARSITHWA